MEDHPGNILLIAYFNYAVFFIINNFSVKNSIVLSCMQ